MITKRAMEKHACRISAKYKIIVNETSSFVEFSLIKILALKIRLKKFPQRFSMPVVKQ